MDFCLYLWQCQCRDSEMHLKHVIILGNPLRPEMEKLKSGSACWLPWGAQHGAGTCRLQWWDQHRAHSDWQELRCMEHKRNCHSCWVESNMIFKLALCSISLWSSCLCLKGLCRAVTGIGRKSFSHRMLQQNIKWWALILFLVNVLVFNFMPLSGLQGPLVAGTSLDARWHFH